MNAMPLSRRYTYPKSGWFGSPLRQDAWLVLALAAILAVHPRGELALALGVAIPLIIGWSLITLHLPSRVDIEPDGISFSAYGRQHRFAWRDIDRIHVRRFIVGDRVLVRIAPSTPLSGRYWLMRSLTGYDELLRALEKGGGKKDAPPAARESR